MGESPLHLTALRPRLPRFHHIWGPRAGAVLQPVSESEVDFGIRVAQIFTGQTTTSSNAVCGKQERTTSSRTARDSPEPAPGLTLHGSVQAGSRRGAHHLASPTAQRGTGEGVRGVPRKRAFLHRGARSLSRGRTLISSSSLFQTLSANSLPAGTPGTASVSPPENLEGRSGRSSPVAGERAKSNLEVDPPRRRSGPALPRRPRGGLPASGALWTL